MSETNTSVEDNSARMDRAAVERIVPRTAVRQIAQECARAIFDKWAVGEHTRYGGERGFFPAMFDEVVERLEQTLDAINETRQEEGIPTS